MTIGTWLLVALLGGTGSIARFVVDGLVGERAGGGGSFPWGTFAVNISGARCGSSSMSRSSSSSAALGAPCVFSRAAARSNAGTTFSPFCTCE